MIIRCRMRFLKNVQASYKRERTITVKKIALVLALVLCLMGAAAAEGTAALTDIQIPDVNALYKNIEAQIEIKDESAALSAEEEAFAVSVTDELIQVVNKGVVFELSRISGSGLICCTPNFLASYNEYTQIFEDPIGMYDIVTGNDIALLIVDSFTNGISLVYAVEGDMLSEFIGNLSKLSEADCNYVLAALGGGEANLYVTKNNTWITAGNNALTICSGKYVVVELLSGTAEDSQFVMDELVISEE